MNQQTIATIDINTDQVDLETLRLQLEDDGKDYCVHRNQNSEGRKRLLHTLRNNDCRDIVTAIEDRDGLASVFVLAGGRAHVDLLEAFLNHGMDIDVGDENGYTALIHASYSGREECVRFLLDHNASVNVRNHFGFTALMEASHRGHTKIVEMLLAKNVNLDIQNKSGMNALMQACHRGRKEIVQLLLNYGADTDLKSKDGKTALDLAMTEEIKEMIRNHVTTTGYVLK